MLLVLSQNLCVRLRVMCALQMPRGRGKWRIGTQLRMSVLVILHAREGLEP